MGVEQNGSCSPRVAGQGCRAWFRGALGALVCRGRRLVPPPQLGMGSGNDDHCDQRGGRSNQRRDGRMEEGSRRGGDSEPVALLHD